MVCLNLDFERVLPLMPAENPPEPDKTTLEEVSTDSYLRKRRKLKLPSHPLFGVSLLRL
jgi:hypothetical protein